MSSRKIFINEEKLGNINYFSLTGMIEINALNNGNFLVNDLIFFSITEKFNTSNSKSMSLKCFDIWNLIAAFDEVRKTGKSNYRKFKDAKLSSHTNNENLKYLMIKKDKDEIYLNMNIKGKDSNDEKILLSVKFQEYEIQGIIKTLEGFAKEIKELQYKAQRAYKKLNNKANEEK